MINYYCIMNEENKMDKIFYALRYKFRFLVHLHTFPIISCFSGVEAMEKPNSSPIMSCQLGEHQESSSSTEFYKRLCEK
jgi:hypothetical protein